MLLRDADETRRLGARLGARARSGDLVCLIGPLGAGKTTFAQGFARGAGVKNPVVSPSFGLARRYRARRGWLYHLDLYRIRPSELANLGLEEYTDDPGALCLIEWPEAAGSALPSDRLELRLAHHASGGRTAAARAKGPRSRRLWRP